MEQLSQFRKDEPKVCTRKLLDKAKPPGSSSFPAAETNTNTHSLTEESGGGKLKSWSLAFEPAGEILLSYLPLELEAWPKSLGRFGVLPDGEIFINPAILSPLARLSEVISAVAITIKEEGVFSILVPLLWAKKNYPESAEMLNDIERFVRATTVEIKESQSHGA
jgi:hypothetical protein